MTVSQRLINLICMLPRMDGEKIAMYQYMYELLIYNQI